tara:strand:+ start:2142 stop:2579 length:438 start_codon:yes stop_codon:yes gene_type:complete
MIRIGENKDVQQGVKLLEEHRKEFDFGQFKEDNTEYYTGLFKAIAKDKTSIISQNNNEYNGMIMGLKFPNLLNPHLIQLHVLITWVHPNKRGSSVFYRMHKAFEKMIKENHKEVKEIIYYSIPTTNINFNKLNYKEFQSMYKKEI